MNSTSPDLLIPESPIPTESVVHPDALQPHEDQLSDDDQKTFDTLVHSTEVAEEPEVHMPEAADTVIEADATDLPATDTGHGFLGRMKERASKVKNATREAGYFVTGQVLASANVTGNRLRSDSSSPENNKLMRNVKLGVLALSAASTYLGAGYAAAKGIDLGGAHEVLQPGAMGGGGNHNIMLASTVDTLPDMQDTLPDMQGAPHEALPEVHSLVHHETNNTANVENIINDDSHKTSAGGGMPGTNPPPAPIIKDSPDIVGDTWDMPEYKSEDDSVSTLAHEQLKAAFTANGLDPETITPEQSQEAVNAFMHENNVTDSTNMHVQSYDMGEFKKSIHDTVTETLQEKAGNANPAVPPQMPELSADELAGKLKDLNIDPAKLPETLNIPDQIIEGDGTSNMLANEQLGLTPEQQAEAIKLLNSDEMRHALTTYAPESFYDYTYPEGDPSGLGGEHELRLKYHDGGHLLTPEKHEQIDKMYRMLLDEIEKNTKTP